MLPNYSRKGLRVLFWAAIMSGAILFFGCSGDNGDTGPAGPPGPEGPAGPVTTTSESCDVCHGPNKIADIAEKHPDPTGQDVTLSKITLTNSGGTPPTVTFHAATAGGPVTDLVLDDFKFMIADLVPAGTDTLGGWGTWSSDYFERWAYESPPSRFGTYPQGTLTNLSNGDYSYLFATSFADATNEAPDYNENHKQRLAIVVSGHNDASGNAVTNNTVGFLDFTIPAAGGTVTTYDSQRQFVTADACKKCHSPRFQKAHHADTYLDTRTCVICHSPIGHYGTEMQEDAAYLPVLVHQIHDAVTGPRFDWSDVTYPQNIAKCVVCHTDSGLNLGTGDQIDHWKTNPSMEVCGSCHTDVNFATGENHLGGIQTDNAGCVYCHPATGHLSPGAGASVTEAHDTAPTAVLHPTPENVPEFDVTLTITAPNNGTYYIAGEAPVVTVTLKDHTSGLAVDPAIYTTPQDSAGVSGGGLHVAGLYVYGTRAKSVPVLATGTITDPAFDADTDTPTQEHDLFVGGDDPQVTTDSSGFHYQLLPIPADMDAGTYMVRVRIGDYGRVGSGDYHIESTAFTNIQIGTATVEEKVAGDACVNCHGTGTAPFHDERHAVVFDTDQCLACHDQSGNFAIPIANRVHAVHSANSAGDLYNITGGSGRDWADITYPQNILSPVTGHTEDDGNPRCVGCHTSGDTTYKTLPYMMPCVGCHADAGNSVNPDGDLDHMRQNGGPF